MDHLKLVGLPGLLALTRGRADVAVGLVDGPVALTHPDLDASHIRTLPETPGACRDPASLACRHGTFVAGILAARRGARAPAIAPGCTLLVRPIFPEVGPAGELPSATPGELAAAIVDCVDAGAWVLNLSAAVAGGSISGERALEEAFGYAAGRDVLVVMAAGNEGAVGGPTISRHPWVIPVAGYTQAGQPLAWSNLGRSIGSGGLGAPGEGVVSLTLENAPVALGGTSVAAPFVTGAAALLLSAFPDATAADVRHALLASAAGRRGTVAPPLLNAHGAYEYLSRARARRAML